MEIDFLSSRFAVRRLHEEDIDLIYDLCRRNVIFYQYHPPFVTRESIIEDMHILPPGKEAKDKYYIGLFENEKLAAIMDLILGYPAKDIAFIGLFMVNTEYQGKGVGSKIIAECVKYLRESGFNKIRLGVDKGNPQSSAFWKKNGFAAVSEGEYILMELAL